MSQNRIRKKIPIKIFYKNETDIPSNKSEKITRSKNNSSLNSIVYEYPISILKEVSQYEKYKERLILSGKPKKEKKLINPNYHHISFKSHSKSILLNPNEIFKNIKNKNLIELYKNVFKNMQKMKTNDDLELRKILQRNNSNPLFRPFQNDKNKTSTNFDLNNLFQKIYLNQIERRGFNYNKLKICEIQRNAMYNFSKLDENFLDNDTNIKANFVLEVNSRKTLPKMKSYFINKMNLLRMKNEYMNEKKFKLDSKPKGVINIKKDPNFKFHVFHDKFGKIRDLEKPYERNLKMTDIRIRDLVLFNKIKQVRDPEIIQKFRTAII